MNAKIGLPLWITPRPALFDAKTMIVGIDIYHKLVAKSNSCVGFVSSLDPQFSIFYSKVSITKPGAESCQNIA